FGLLGCSGSSSPETEGTEQPDAGLFINNTIVVNEETRTYDYYVPSMLGDSPNPLVMILHGGGSNTDDMTGESGFKAPYKVWMDIADAEKFIVVYPEGTMNPLGGLGWNDCRADATTNPSADDVGFIELLIDNLANSFNIDANRVYASGTSNGGHMSLRLALELSNRIAAVAPVVAAMPAISCSGPAGPISVLFMNGTDDPLLPYNGGEVAPSIGGRGTVLSAQESVDYWVDFNHANSNPVVADIPDVNVNDGSTVKIISYFGGDEGTQVELYEVSGGGHLEPSMQEQYATIVEVLLGRQNHDIEMAEEIWSFFKNKTLQ
ncbi:MAG: hypothetical protein L3J79_02570, partial [Candidatus Marinimicrobia bacterium]|nr:hypothetical protein [Candidatus Neomarinimicrobiota bacterium]